MSTNAQNAEPSKRNRIVIDLEKSAPDPRLSESPLPINTKKGGGRLGRILLLVFGVLGFLGVCLIVGIFFFWHSYKQKPAYSLALLVDAAQRNDTATFDSIVDTDRVVDNLIPQLTAQTGDPISSFVSPALRRQAESMIPGLIPGAKARIHDAVVTEVKLLSTRAENKPFLLIALGMPWVASVNQTNENADVTVQLPDRSVALTMQHSGEIWKIVNFKDDQLTAKIIDSIKQDVVRTVNPLPPFTKPNKHKGNAPAVQTPSVVLPSTKQ